MVIDQDNLLVVSENFGDIIYTDQFKHFVEEQEIRMYVCRKADPESKGYASYCTSCVLYNFSLPRLAIFFLISITVSSLGGS